MTYMHTLEYSHKSIVEFCKKMSHRIKYFRHKNNAVQSKPYFISANTHISAPEYAYNFMSNTNNAGPLKPYLISFSQQQLLVLMRYYYLASMTIIWIMHMVFLFISNCHCFILSFVLMSISWVLCLIISGHD